MKESLAQRFEFLRSGLAFKVVAGFLIAALLYLTAIVLGYFPDPMNARSIGPGWECDPTPRSALTCDKDAPIPKPRKQH
jgi:hypothetical protein